MLHAFLTLQGERNAPFAMLMTALGGAGSGGAGRAPGPPGRSGRPVPYSMWQPKPGRGRLVVNSVHVEAPLAAIGAHIPIGNTAPYERQGRLVKRGDHPLAGVGKARRQRR